MVIKNGNLVPRNLQKSFADPSTIVSMSPIRVSQSSKKSKNMYQLHGSNHHVGSRQSHNLMNINFVTKNEFSNQSNAAKDS
jgi:hypothetical protein